jgi:Uma2 family endonuclease
MRAKAALYLSTGCLEFWIVEPKKKEIQVMRREGGSRIYGTGDKIPMPLSTAKSVSRRSSNDAIRNSQSANVC